VRPDGSVILPAEVRSALNLGPGGVIVAKFDGADFSMTDALTSARRAQAMVSRFKRPGVSVVDELIAERRAEAAREDAGG
jgi:hypothetical protein